MKIPIKTGIASFGMSGMVFHAPLLNANPGFEIKAIVERTKDLSRKLYSTSRLVRSLEELLEDNDIELVIINTPDFLHFKQARQVLKAGKHVVVEKPFTQKYEEAVELDELAKSLNLVLSVFQNRRWDGDFLTIQKIISDKMLGRLVTFESHFERYRNYIQENSWKEETSSGTGIVYNLGSHLIDQVIVLFGKPSAVNADIRTLRTNGQTDDYFDIRMEYSENLCVSIGGSMLVKEPGPRYILHGTEGSFLKWGTDPQEQNLKDGMIPGTEGWGKEHEDDWGILNTTENGIKFRGEIETIPGNYPHFYNLLYDSIRKGTEVPVKVKDAALVIRIINAAFKSSREGKRILI
jgi:scyllo-inositol 2-dehydrogenase (NADP+)